MVSPVQGSVDLCATEQAWEQSISWLKKNGTKSGAAMAALVPTALSALRG